MPYQPNIDNDRLIDKFGPYAFMALLALAIFLFSMQKPSPPPPNAAAFGCYVSADHPSILIDQGGLHIVGTRLQAVSFRLEWNDEGIYLWPDKMIELTAVSDHSYFELREGPGNAFVFVKMENGKLYPNTNAATLETFEFSDTSYRRVIYRNDLMSNCTPG